MPLFVPDETILVPGILQRGTLAHRLLVLGAYGRLRRFARVGGLEHLADQPLEPGGTPMTDLAADDATRAATLGERLPPGTPDEWLIVTSTWIMRYVGIALRDERVGSLFGSTDEDVFLHQAAALSLAITSIELPQEIPEHAGHPKLDALIETAFASGARFVVSENPSIARYHDDEDSYTGGPDEVRVMRLSRFVALYVNDLDFDLDGVDSDEDPARSAPNLLDVAFAQLRPLGPPPSQAPVPEPERPQPPPVSPSRPERLVSWLRRPFERRL